MREEEELRAEQSRLAEKAALVDEKEWLVEDSKTKKKPKPVSLKEGSPHLLPFIENLVLASKAPKGESKRKGQQTAKQRLAQKMKLMRR